MLPDRVLVFEEPLRKGFVDHRDLARRRGVVLGNGPAQHDLRADGFEESRHHARPAGAGVFLGAAAPACPAMRMPSFQLSPVMGA